MDLLQELYNVLRDNHTTSYNTVSATVLVFYETVITLNQEIHLIWRSSWSFVNALYLLIRYYSLVYLILNSYVSANVSLSEKFCGPYDVFQTWGAVALLPAVDILIILRIYALYQRSKKIGVLLVVLWLAEAISVLASVHYGFNTTSQTMPNPLPGILPGCYPLYPPDLQHIVRNVLRSGAIAAIFQAVYLGLTMFVLYQQVRPLGFALSPILKVFLRDGAVYCFILLVMYVSNVLLLRYQKGGPLEGVGEVWLVAVFSITACRLVLNLKDIGKPSVNLSSDISEFKGTWRARTAPDWRFKSGSSVSVTASLDSFYSEDAPGKV